MHRRTPGHRLIQYAGPIVLFGIILTWVVLFAIGWALVLGAPGALEGANGNVTLAQRMHVAAVTVAGRGTSPLRVSTAVGGSSRSWRG